MSEKKKEPNKQLPKPQPKRVGIFKAESTHNQGRSAVPNPQKTPSPKPSTPPAQTKETSQSEDSSKKE